MSSHFIYLEVQAVPGLQLCFDQDSPSHPQNLVLLKTQVSL